MVNHKRTERLYREEGLSLRLRPHKRRPGQLRSGHLTPGGPGEQWGMDFVSDNLMSGRRIRILTILDLWDSQIRHWRRIYRFPSRRTLWP